MRFNGWSFEQNTRLGEAAEPDESVFFFKCINTCFLGRNLTFQFQLHKVWKIMTTRPES